MYINCVSRVIGNEYVHINDTYFIKENRTTNFPITNAMPKNVTLPHDKHTYENIWTPCQIVDYDESKRVFQIIWYDNNNNNIIITKVKIIIIIITKIKIITVRIKEARTRKRK